MGQNGHGVSVEGLKKKKSKRMVVIFFSPILPLRCTVAPTRGFFSGFSGS